MNIFIVLLVIILFALLIYYLYNDIYSSKNTEFQIDKQAYISRQKQYFPLYNTWLLEYSAFYRRLNAVDKEKFLERICLFRKVKTWLCPNGFSIQDKEMILIASTAVQLTFGIEEYLLSYYHTIEVYPDIYYNDKVATELKGMATFDGAIQLSWKFFEENLSNNADNLNLGLHEFAHALHYQCMVVGQEFNLKFANNYSKWEKLAIEELNQIRKGKPMRLLRPYAATNLHEYWAVSIEYFYESPHEFKMYLPEQYNLLCKTLNFDPINFK